VPLAPIVAVKQIKRPRYDAWWTMTSAWIWVAFKRQASSLIGSSWICSRPYFGDMPPWYVTYHGKGSTGPSVSGSPGGQYILSPLSQSNWWCWFCFLAVNTPEKRKMKYTFDSTPTNKRRCVGLGHTDSGASTLTNGYAGDSRTPEGMGY
jgi:hypothetical protein